MKIRIPKFWKKQRIENIPFNVPYPELLVSFNQKCLSSFGYYVKINRGYKIVAEGRTTLMTIVYDDVTDVLEQKRLDNFLRNIDDTFVQFASCITSVEFKKRPERKVESKNIELPTISAEELPF